MQQELKFPARCTAISSQEQETLYGGAPEWAEELADVLWPVWYRAEPVLKTTGVLIHAFVTCVDAAYQIYVCGKIIKHSMSGIKDSLKVILT